MTAGAAADERGPIAHGKVHDLDDLFGMGFGEGAPKDGEILAEHIHEAAIDFAVSCHHAVAQEALFVQPEFAGAVHHKLSYFLKGAGIEQDIQTFTRRQFAFLVLCVDTVLPSSE